MMVYAGIDIGKEGAIAIIRDGEIITFPMPKIKTELDLHQLGRIISTEISPLSELMEGNKVHIVFEKLGVIFGSSKQTAFSMGMQAGAVETFCICGEIPYTKVRAVDWQKDMFQGLDQITKPSKTGKKEVRDTKAMALVAIKRIFPKLKLTFGERATKPHDGLIDAVLMAEYARRKNL
jgi:hypothetical protein